ncbi:MAG: hypothetical protein Faunusvirus29_3 [Faunusvirus sp.]|jgi:hypothetical protein|uniref:Ankyrin repeat protein n=1 Tax=Faunusvirus sp. TaxID=2487766 RepID=A0A3G4ZZ82_9VIRU|nr:MAG: hypothetical protein Faunusvirus29_3 [Faunusvirus sp.]
MNDPDDTAIKHLEYFYKLIDESPIDETACIVYINRYNDFYEIEYGLYRSTVLMHCMWRNVSDKIITELVNRGANPNTGNMYIRPLEYAIYNFKLDIAKLLIDKGAAFDEYMNNACFRGLKKYIKLKYQSSLLHMMNDKSADNIMGNCFATTYVPQLVDVICDFIL